MLRKDAGLTQEQLVFKAWIEKNYVSLIGRVFVCALNWPTPFAPPSLTSERCHVVVRLFDSQFGWMLVKASRRADGAQHNSFQLCSQFDDMDVLSPVMRAK